MIARRPAGLSSVAPTRRRFLHCSAAAGLAGAGLATGFCLCGSGDARAASLPFEEVEDGVFLRLGRQEMANADNGGAIANIGFVVGAASVAAIDTGSTRQEGEALLAAIASVTDKPISHVIATHVHPDHGFGHAAFAGSDADFIGHRRLPDALTERGPFYLEQLAELLPDAEGTEVVTPTVTVEDRLEIDLGDRVLVLTAWPAAHTDSDLTMFDGKTGLFWASDLLFADRLPTLDGSLAGWIAAMDTLIPADAALVVPGHGAPGEGRAALMRQRDYLAGLRQAVRAAIDDGLDMTETVAALGDGASGSDSRNWLLYEENHGRNIVAAYAELEWE
jgi:quinoprotein relay system zinc metallohydrolase 2